MAGTILFVDDEPDLRFIATEFLKMAGHTVLTASRPAEALEMARSGPLSTIILDANLPDTGSAALLSALKQQHPQTPVIIFSGRPEEDDVVQSLLNSGADRFVQKEGSLEKLIETVKNLHSPSGNSSQSPRS